MQILYGVIMALVIGFVACVFMWTVIGKIGEEQRRNSDYALKQIDSIFRKLPGLCMDTFKEVKKLEEEQNKEEAKKYEKKQEQLRKEFEGLDEWPEI